MNFQFATPWLLGLIFFIPLLGMRHFLLRKGSNPATIKYTKTNLMRGLPNSWRVRLRPGLYLLRLISLTLVILALGRPQYVQGNEIISGEGVEIALALDISGSMASLDFEPNNRLEAAKYVISDFVAEREYDKLGLVVFASEAFSQSPLTLDHNMLNRSLDQVELATDLGLDDGTAIGLGLANAANMLANSEAESKTTTRAAADRITISSARARVGKRRAERRASGTAGAEIYVEAGHVHLYAERKYV